MGGGPKTATPSPPAAMSGMRINDAGMGVMPMNAMQDGKVSAAAPPMDHAADRYFDPGAMAAAREALREDHGGMVFSQVMDNLAEYQARSSGGGGYRWDGEAWIGGDVNRLVIKSEGAGDGRGGLEGAEAQGLYSRAIGPYVDAQAGVRQDFAPHPKTFATFGAEALAPYWIDVDAALFVSTDGEVLLRAEGLYDLRLSQRLVLQPRVELNFAAQNTAETRIGEGLCDAELGLTAAV